MATEELHTESIEEVIDMSHSHAESEPGSARIEPKNAVVAGSLGTWRLTFTAGNPGLEIAEFAEEIGAALIVIPSHGYHGVKRWILGSVAERVIRHAKCSVLVLRRSDAV